jgi:uncharacterized membrane protein YraQ (UPF0718 family)
MERSLILVLVTLGVVFCSALANPKKTWQGLKKGGKMFVNMLPPFLTVIILVSIFLGLMPQDILAQYLGHEAGFFGMVLAAFIGSIALIPGFIAYPLSAILLQHGVSYQVIAVFITTLMMVGVLTLPIEIRYFGVKVSLLRNGLSFFGALLIGLIIGGLL